ncbi:MAG TPA: hypothetical protein PK400_00840 [Phycisphaerales bacterium]|nr:hypothetical protein [Phycisphaerales bacterium]HRQ74631.1 hypothetical protein [Phycisphaerales bacterium]
MPFFRRKKSDDQPADAGGGSSNDAAPSSAGDFEPQPEKARKWFEHAKTYADTFNFEGALSMYANGIKLDPESMSAHEGMLEAAVKYMNKGGKPASSKELRELSGSHPVARFAAAEFAWMKDLRNATLAIKTLDAAVKAGQREYGHWIAPRVLALLRNQKKVSKSVLLQAKELFKEVAAWDQAIAAGEEALRLDPTDNDLAHEIKDISAQRAMDQGGYEQSAGQEGGFRKFIKDADKQRELIESESISGGQSVEERLFERAKAAYEQTPTLPDAINQYGQQLKKKGDRESLQLAFDVYMKGFADTNEYRFRMLAGDIKIEIMSRKLRKLHEQLEANGEDEALRAQFRKLKSELLQLQATEYGERVEKYPTDRHRKFDYGQVLYELGRYEEAMGQFQDAKDEPKLRVRAGHMLGRCFARENWHPEAIAEYKDAINAIDVTEKDRELVIRYDLMASLIAQAREEQSMDLAKEALEICSGIARKNITYRDIRGKRKEIDQLIRDLGSAPASD